jgi:hypothetical protein
MLRRSILPRFTASARIARVPIATAPTAVAPTARAPRPMAPIATRPNAICVPPSHCPTVHPAESEHGQGVYSEADSPAQQWPVEPPHTPCEHVDDEQADVDQDEGTSVDIEALQGLHTSPGSFVALLVWLHPTRLSFVRSKEKNPALPYLTETAHIL